MSSTERRSVRIMGTVLILGAGVLAAGLLAIPVLGALVVNGVRLPRSVPFSTIETFYYMGTRDTWQMREDCAMTDPVLIYRPRAGECRFANLEYKTRQHFDADGRAVPARQGKSGRAIAILGDSHAMGWGVEDDETFANVLQKRTGRPVYNLGVSSYATEREMERFLAWPGHSQADTLVIQYCDNDYEENVRFPIDRALAARRYREARAAFDRSFGKRTLRAYSYIFSEALPGHGEPTAPTPSVAEQKAAMLRVLAAYPQALRGKNVIVFYVNSYGAPMPGFAGTEQVADTPVRFVDLHLDRDRDFYGLDDHLDAEGQARVGRALAGLVQASP